MRTVVISKVEQAFHAALAAREAGALIDLQSICEGDPLLIDEVQTLLRHFDEAESSTHANGSKPGFLNPAELHVQNTRAMLEEWGTTTVGQRVGEFTLIGQVGSGAMGVVFLAEQDRPRRTVALKIIRRNVATPGMIRRFEREAQLLGRLNHVGIAQVYGAGVAEIATDAGDHVGAPYIAMEYVNGPTILQFVRDHPGDCTLVLNLMMQVCSAVQHAHQRGIIHRDLKPANILVSLDQSGQPQVKVLDFGVARQAERDSTDPSIETHLTLHGHFIGTPAYMSPEQMRSSEDLDTRSDVYALGAILYQLLADRLPIATSDCTLAEAARRIAEHQPTRLGAVRRELRGDIETIVAKALEKDPQRRYQSAAELCRDIQHHLAGEMIEVRRDSLLYLMAQKAARYRNLFIAAALLLIAGIGFAGFARHQQQNERLAEREAESARRRADETAAELAGELSATRIEEGRLLGLNNELVGAERLLWDEWFEHPKSLAANWALRELYWRSQCTRVFSADASECRTVAVAPDDRTFATAGTESVIRIWSFSDSRKIAEWETGLTSVRAICYLPSGRQIAVAGDGGARIVDVATGTVRTLGEPKGIAYTVDCASTGLAIAVGGDDGVIRLFDPDTTALIAAIPSKPLAVRAVRFDSSCYHLAAIDGNGTAKLWQLHLEPDAASVTLRWEVDAHSGWVGTALSFSPDGTLVATGGSDRTVKLWRMDDGSLVKRVVTNNGPVRGLSFSADGQRMVVPGYWRTQLVDVGSGTITALGDAGGYDAKFVGENNLVLAAADGTCRMWDFDRGPLVLHSTSSQVRELSTALIGNEYRLAVLQLDGTLRILKTAAPMTEQANWQTAMSINVGVHARTLDMSADGTWIVVGGAKGHVLTIRAADGQVIQDWPAIDDALVDVVRIAPDGRSLVIGGQDGKLLISKRRSDENGWESPESFDVGGEIASAAISPDGANLVTTSKPLSLRFWSYPDGKLLREFSCSKTPWKLAFSADGQRLAVGTWDRTIRVWNTGLLKSSVSSVCQEMNLVGHTQLVTGEAFDSTGRLMASIATDGTIRLWDVSGDDCDDSDQVIGNRRRCLATFDCNIGDAYSVAFLPATGGMKGDALAVGFIDGTVRIWQLGTFDQNLDGHIQYQRQLRGRGSAGMQ